MPACTGCLDSSSESSSAAPCVITISVSPPLPFSSYFVSETAGADVAADYYYCAVSLSLASLVAFADLSSLIVTCFLFSCCRVLLCFFGFYD